MSLSESVHKFIEKEKLFLRKHSLLCAVSGGIDSMVMLDILRRLGYTVAVAHVNYMLRDEEAQADQTLVHTYCTTHKLSYHSLKVTAEEIADLKSGNLQEKARKIRYDWFKRLLASEGYDYVCLAHHQEDIAETFLFNAIRGSGLNGLRSIQSKTEYKRRPLLATSREEIIQYAQLFKVPFRHDQTNELDIYDRNYIRNKLIPVIKAHWPKGSKTLARTARICTMDYMLLENLVAETGNYWLKIKNGIISFGPLDAFKRLKIAQNLAYHLLSKYNFNESQVRQMLTDQHQSGILFYSHSHEAVYDRNFLLIQKRTDVRKIHVKMEHAGSISVATGQLNIEPAEYIELSKDPLEQFIDATKVEWPIYLRTWENGDTLSPLGMGGQHKKVSDILTDRKVSLLAKRRQLVVVDNKGVILWLIGQQLSESCKLTKKTKEYLKLTWSDFH